jgi:hypothetical protein
MNDQYSRFLLEIQLVKRRLAQVFEVARDVSVDSSTSPIVGGAPVAAGQDRAVKRQMPAQDSRRSGNIFRDSRRKLGLSKRSDQTNRDMSAFSFTLTLQVLGTIGAAHTNHPVFWLLVGPMPLAVGFTLVTFIRQGVFRSIRKNRRMTGWTFSGMRRKESLVPPRGDSSDPKILKSQWSSCAAY